MKTLSTLDWVAFVLLVVGGLNWGLVGALNFNLVNTLFGTMPAIESIVYSLVGLSAIYVIYVLSTKRQTM